jgi:predicted transcriptional regulator
MKITIDIDMNNAKALALLNYIRTLDFISLNENMADFSDEQKAAIDKALLSVEEGKTTAHDKVMQKLENKYPKYFAK